MIRQARTIQDEVAIRGVAAGSKILESVSQDAHAAENLMLFNQQRRMQGKGALKPWEQEAFAWVDHNVDRYTGKTRRKQRDEALKEKWDGKA